MTWKTLRLFLVETFSCFSEHNVPRLGAALAYYSLLSIAPLMIVIVTICSWVFQQAAQQDVLQATQQYIGSAGAHTLRMFLDNAHRPDSGLIATCIALLTSLFGASGMFLELRSALNTIWEVPLRPLGGVRGLLSERVGSFLMVVGLGLLLLISLLVSAGLALVEKFASGYLPISAALTAEIVNTTFSFLSLWVLFALIYRFVPEVPIKARDVALGALISALLFIAGKALLALYFNTAAVGSAYGAAGSVVALVVWVYYSAQIFFFGAVFTRVIARQHAKDRVLSTPRKPISQRSPARSRTST